MMQSHVDWGLQVCMQEVERTPGCITLNRSRPQLRLMELISWEAQEGPGWTLSLCVCLSALGGP